jgi:geranylgeranyl diphosphate synthase type II
MLAGCGKQELENLEEYGTCIGHAFQISDDILDETGNAEKMGKKPGQDKKLNKSTYPKFYGIEQSKKLLWEKIQKAINAVEIFGDKAEPLRLIAEFIGTREN